MPSNNRLILAHLWTAFAAFAVAIVLGLWQMLEGPDSPLYFYTLSNRGLAVGWFANRNHLASFLASCVPMVALKCAAT